jgi:pyruvate/2-oxoglutarate dehydrogenase complex dihydrolipoamide dehydrogenase (E3) component
MILKDYDAVIIGCGAAGMSAAIAIRSQGFSVAIIDREKHMGGILLQCIHNGFGLHHFKEELTGPEYAERLADEVKSLGIEIFLATTVLEMNTKEEIKTLYACTYGNDLFQFKCRAVVLAMGCRERNRGNIGTAGTRPSGVFTAGLAQRLLNIDGYLPGRNIVIIGSGDIGLIMARRLIWSGCSVKAVIEIMPTPSGITRNIVQCLEDFSIPLYLSHAVTKIIGKDRVEKVEVTPLEHNIPNVEKSFEIECDTVLLSVGLIPENELSEKAGVDINRDTSGPYVDSHLMTNNSGVFACGNVLHVHDLVDFVSEEAARCGNHVAAFLRKEKADEIQYKVQPGSNIRYVVPNRYSLSKENHFYMRPLIVKCDAVLEVKRNGKTITEKKLHRVQPSEMISLVMKPEDLAAVSSGEDNVLEISVK